MKYKLIVVLTIISFQVFGQRNLKTLKITYRHLSAKSDFPKPFSYSFNTYLYINDSVSQYNFARKTKTVRNGNYQTQIGQQVYINNYFFKTGIMEEQRQLKKGKIRAKWKPNYNWTITNDTKTIKGYLCKKATTNSIEVDPDKPAYYGQVTAWFTEEIPLPAGPDRYCELPGLILEIEYENSIKKTTVEAISFNENIDIKFIDEGIEMPDKFDVIYYYHKNNKLVKTLLKKNNQ
jgi:GLPGLI family protein